MTRIDEMSVEQQKRMARMGIVVVVGALATGIITFLWLLPNSWANGMKAGYSMFAIVRNSLPIIYGVNCISGAILCEFADSQTKRRAFKPLNALLFLILLGEYFLMIAAFLTFFDLLFGSVSALVQFLLLAAGLAVPLFPVLGTLKIQRFQDFIKKAFE
jgi:hypothetical protein